MKIRLIYFSGTGNTELIAKQIAGSFDARETETFYLGDIEPGSLSLETGNTLLGFGYPVYDYQPPRIMGDFMKKLPEAENPVPVFLFSTQTTDRKDCNDRVAALLKEKSYYVIAMEGFTAPGAVISLYSRLGKSLAKKKTRFEKNIDLKIRKFSDKIKESYAAFQKNPYALPMKILRGMNFWYSLSSMTVGRIFYRNLKVCETCLKCGKCVHTCPDNNLKMENDKLIIKKSNGCLRCLRCVQVCPVRAINFTSAKRRGDYTREEAEIRFIQAFSD